MVNTHSFILPPFSRKASDEGRQNMMACGLGGALANLAEAGALSEQSGGKV